MQNEAYFSKKLFNFQLSIKILFFTQDTNKTQSFNGVKDKEEDINEKIFVMIENWKNVDESKL